MTLESVPASIWRVTVNNRSQGVFTTRDEVRTHRRTLRADGVASNQMTTVRYSVSPQG